MDESAIKQLVTNAIQENQNAMLSSIENLMSNKLGSFENSIKESQRQLSDTQLATIEEFTTDSYEFKRKGNKEQDKINTKVMKKMKEAQSLIRDSPAKNEQINSASQSIGEGIDLLSHRQKLVKMADQSENGWKTVEEYETHCLAENSDDEKRIRRADIRAGHKLKTDKKFKRNRFNPIQTTSTRSSTPIPVQVTPPKRPGKCYECGKPGHWRKDHANMQNNSYDNKAFI